MSKISLNVISHVWVIFKGIKFLPSNMKYAIFYRHPYLKWPIVISNSLHSKFIFIHFFIFTRVKRKSKSIKIRRKRPVYIHGICLIFSQPNSLVQILSSTSNRYIV